MGSPFKIDSKPYKITAQVVDAETTRKNLLPTIIVLSVVFACVTILTIRNKIKS
jgi:hypothetical protein